MASAGSTIATLLVLGAAGAATWWFVKNAPTLPRAQFAPAGPNPWTIPRPGKGPIATSGRPEALKWLENNPQRFAFGANIFQTTERAQAYVEHLYRLGAEKIIVSGIRAEPGVPGASADTLFLKLPNNKEQRDALVHFILTSSESPDEFSRVSDHKRIRQSPDEGRGSIGPDSLKGGNVLRLWWD